MNNIGINTLAHTSRDKIRHTAVLRLVSYRSLEKLRTLSPAHAVLFDHLLLLVYDYFLSTSLILRLFLLTRFHALFIVFFFLNNPPPPNIPPFPLHDPLPI